MKIDIYQVDAFTGQAFKGNPAAVCPLDDWLADELMQQIAMENNLSETAFFVPESDGFGLRWFTPQTEVALCGHATLATAHVLFEHMDYNKKSVSFNTRSGTLEVEKKDAQKYAMNFPASKLPKETVPEPLADALGMNHYKVCFKADDYMLVLDNEEQVPILACLQRYKHAA
jgi:PhzF family phenazine biosynthesis protein